jgi:DNA primase catalytic core
MGLHKLTAGDGYTYLTRQVAAHDTTEKGHTSLGDYYDQQGESPGRWVGSGLAGVGLANGEPVTAAQMKSLFGDGRHPNAAAVEDAVIAAGGSKAAAIKAGALGRAFPIYEGSSAFQIQVAQQFSAWNIEQGRRWDAPIPAGERAHIRTAVGTGMFTEMFSRPPADARELSGFIARASRQATTAVAGYDLTFSPVKSVSALWAIAPRQIAEQIEAAHHAAVADTLAWLETRAAYTREGRAGVRQVETNGLIAAAFTHRDARSGDPNLHTHVAVSNKVQARDGRWLALDGRVLYKANVSASERYNTRLEAELRTRLGLWFADRTPTDVRKRPVREIVGVDERLSEYWSSRRAAIDARRAVLAAQFQADHGRPPTEMEAIALAQRATLETRAAKHEPRSLAEQRAAWRQQAIRVLGSPGALDRLVATAVSRGRREPAVAADAGFIADTAATVVSVVQSDRATWQVWHVRAEAERQLRAAAVARAELDDAAERVVARALRVGSIRLGVDDPIPEPARLRRRDGSSVYLVAGSHRYTSQAILNAERTLLQAALRRDGRALTDVQVGVALAESAANRFELNPAQAQMVRELATSGARVQVAIAPAGSGKTTAMRTLARAWTGSGGTIIGLAPSARAAAELRREIHTPGCDNHGDTLAKLTYSLTSGFMPRWVRNIGPDTLVIIDEAGMAGTADLAQAVHYILGRGGSVRLVGDDQQLASIAAGGALRDIADQVGVVTLSELQRFHDPAEGAATLALRLGDAAGLGFYLDHGRVHVGDETTVTDHAYRAWAADRSAGLDSVMLAPTRDLVAVLNARARADRLAADGRPTGAEVQLADGNRGSIGDTIITRVNNRELRTSATDWVKNGDRWRIKTVQRSGTVVATHLGTNHTITLPADYVRANTELGYACTVHGAQGITAGTCHTVACGDEARQLFYVAMTRGRTGNHVYLVTASDGDTHNIVRPEALFPPTATDILTAVLRRDQAQQSATSIARDLRDPGVLLHDAVARYHDALGYAAEQVVGPDRLAALDAAADALRAGLTDAPAYPTLRAHLALLSVDGVDPMARLHAVGGPHTRELDTAEDPAAVLDWRLDPTTDQDRGGPLPWLPPVPSPLRSHPQWGPYLTDRAAHVSRLAADVRTAAARWTPTTAPIWATPLLDPTDDTLRGDLAVWRSANGVDPADRRPTGGPQLAAAAERYQRELDTRGRNVLGDPARAIAQWASRIERIDQRIPADPYWPQLAERLAAVERAGIDVRTMLTAAAAAGHLPDEQPAAALWWRLARHLSPAATAATHGSGASTLRPEWTPILLDKLGPVRGQRVLADPAWPALVAAVNAAPRNDWTPEALLAAAVAGTLTGPTDAAGITDGELAAVLVWRIAALTDPEPLDDTDTALDPYEADLAPPDDLHLVEFPLHPQSALAVPADGHEPPAEPAGRHTAEPTVHDASTSDRSTAPPPDDRHDATDPLAALHSAAWRAAVLREPAEPTDDELWAPLNDEYKWATAEVPRLRLVELNTRAADFFAARYRASWAASYLQHRLGTDLSRDGRFTIGYAPSGWTSLTQHLRQQLRATDQEIVAAGLGRLASTGRLIDQFRDRLIFAIHDADGDIAGFIARRNPAYDRDGGDANGGPKYLNTPQTDLFDKGAQLFGQHEGRAELAAGATPVLVEGPVDALAVTIGSDGTHVGVASLGTAFTDAQANRLRPYIGVGRAGVLVATDADTAGWKAAQRAYWQLTARGDTPGHLVMGCGLDPALILEESGTSALRHTLAAAAPLAHALIGVRLAASPLDTLEDRLTAVRRAADVIGALPPNQWTNNVTFLRQRLNAPTAAICLAVIDAGHAWTDDPRGLSRQRLSAITEQPQPTTATTPGTSRDAPQTPPPPARVPHRARSVPDPVSHPQHERWEKLAGSISTAGPDWPALARTPQRAHDAGYDPTADLLSVATDQPLARDLPVRDLQYRLITAVPAAAQTNNAAAGDAARSADHAAHEQMHYATQTSASAPTAAADPPRSPQERWADLANRIDSRLTRDDGWTALAHTLEDAAAAGMDLETALPHLAVDGQLPDRRTAQELQYRVLAASDLGRTHPLPDPGPSPAPRHRQPPTPPPHPDRDRPPAPRR